MSDENQNGKGPFKEAHQFKGVYGKPDLELPSYVSPEVAEKLRARPPLTRDVSLHFSNGDYFDVQEDHRAGTVYLILPLELGGDPHRRQRVNVGEWIVQLHSGRYIKLTDQEFRDMGGVESPWVPCPPYPGQDPQFLLKPYGAPPNWVPPPGWPYGHNK